MLKSTVEATEQKLTVAQALRVIDDGSANRNLIHDAFIEPER